MQAVLGQRLRLVPDGIGQRDALPHIGIEAIDQIGIKAAQRLRHVAAQHDGRALDCQVDENMAQPVIENARRPLRRMAAAHKISLLVDEDMLAKGSTDGWLVRNAAFHRGIEPGMDAIVLMQQMHPAAAGECNAAIPVAGNPAMAIGGMEFYPGETRIAQEREAVEIPRSIIDKSDLHFARHDSGGKNAVDGFAQQPRIGVPAGDHHRPEGPVVRIHDLDRPLVHARRRYSS